MHPISAAKLALVPDLKRPMPSAREKRPKAVALCDIIDRCLKKDRDERFGSAKELAEALERLGGEKGRAADLAEDESPFAGLSAFQEADTARFFGRDSDITAVVGRLRNQELLAIAGPMGVGKSSFVRAGVIPALKRSRPELEAFVVRPGRRPLAALADVLAFLSDTAGSSVEADTAQIVETLRTQPGYLGARLRTRCRKLGSDHRIVLFVDQLEELYTLGIDPGERKAFCACLEGVADDASSPLRVLVTIRADFLDRLTDDRHFLDEVTRGLVFLPPMAREGLRAALEKPVEAAHYRFEDNALAGEILDGLQGTKSALPILQFTATKLWEARDRERKLLTRQAYQALGGVAGALSTHADAVLSGMSLSEQHLARSILMRLVTPERTRAMVQLDELRALSEDGAAVERVVDHLAAARLLSVEAGERDGKSVELTHESLIDRWAKLRQWLDGDEQDAQFLGELRSAAAQWENNSKAEGFLWRDQAALNARQWLERRRAERGAEAMSGLGKRELGYLEAVTRLAERNRRRGRRIVAGSFAAISVIAVIVTGLAISARAQATRADQQAQRADQQAQKAQEDARQARNATRMAAARERQDDPTTVLALLREVEPPGVPRGWAELVRWALGAGVSQVVLVHPIGVRSAAFSPDGTRIVTASWDKTVRVWNADGTGEPLALRGHEERVYSAVYSSDGKRIVTASHDKTARVWNANGTGEPIVLRGHDLFVVSAAFSPDGKRVVTASADKTVRVWSADGTGQPTILRGHDGGVVSTAFSPDGKLVVSASLDKTARVWSADGTGEPLVLRGHEDRLLSVAYSSDGKRVVTASEDRTARVWSADGTGEPLVLRGHEDRVSAAAFSPDGKRVVTGSFDKTVRVWNADGTGQPLVLRGHSASPQSVAFSPDGKRIVSAASDDTARVWSADTSVLILRGHEASARSVAYSPDGKRLATASFDKTVRVWNADGTGQPLVLRGHEGAVMSAAYSPDGKRLVSASSDKTARVWNADGTGEPLVLRGHDASIAWAAFSPDGKRIVTASADTTVRVWSEDGAGEPMILRGHEQQVVSVEYSPDGKHIVTASYDKTARVWNADGTGQPIVLRGHEQQVSSVAFSPDGKRVITAAYDDTARVWNADGTGQPIVLRDHEGGVTSARFSPDGKRIVTASQDKTLRVWNVDGTGEPIVLRGGAQSHAYATFSPDGSSIAAAFDDQTVWVWTDLESLGGSEDPKLWTATTLCLPVKRRIPLLGVSEATARTEQDACVRRVGAARAAASSGR